MKHFLTSESVTEGHPDKMADQISDAILDSVLNQDKKGRVAVETLLTNGVAVIAGEMRTISYVDVPNIARGVIKEIGYMDSSMGFDWQTCGIMVAIQEQSKDIAMGVDTEAKTEESEDLKTLGAGDQGLMYGYACKETPELMPLPITLAHRLTKKLTEVRKDGILDYLRPDGKSQVIIQYEDGVPKRVENVLISTQHSEEAENETIKNDVINKVIKEIVPADMIDADTKFLVNPTGRFVSGGPQADTGLTGRKIIVDTYGGVGSHGGGCFSGKDPSKVDRSGSYAARWVAKNIVAADLADKCEVQVAYAIGICDPLSININTFGTGKLADDELAEKVREVFDLRPGMIIKNLDLRRPIYRQVAAYGHFGRPDLNLPWEKVDKVGDLKGIV